MTDLAALLLRLLLAVVMAAHGLNHLLGGGRIAGTARWFESLGMRPGRLHAWMATLTELAVAPLLAAGLLLPLACAGVVGVMVVAWVVNHLRAGFFVFHRPVEGWEYVMTLTVVAIALAALGAGRWSLDAVWGLELTGPVRVAIAAGGGTASAGVVLGLFWRRP